MTSVLKLLSRHLVILGLGHHEPHLCFSSYVFLRFCKQEALAGDWRAGAGRNNLLLPVSFLLLTAPR